MNKKLLILCVTLLTLAGGLTRAGAQGTAFTYSGRLNSGGSPANGLYDFQFSLFNAPGGGVQIGSTLSELAVGVTNGLFTTVLDFGPVFTGNATWLATSVRTNGPGSYTVLNPLQPLTPSPYAMFANAASNLSGTLSAAQIKGSLANGQLANDSVTVSAGTGLSGGGTVALGGSATLNNAGVLSVGGNADITASTTSGVVTLGSTATSTGAPNTIVKRDASGNFSAGTIAANLAGSATLANNVANGINITNAVITDSVFAGNGAGLNSLSYSQLSGGTVPASALGNAWQIAGNAGTTPGADFLGTTDDQPLEFWVNQSRALLLDPGVNGEGAPNVIGGSPVNYVLPGVTGATIGGGGAVSYSFRSFSSAINSNSVTGDFGTVGGGFGNTASGANAGVATVGGGYVNNATGDFSTVSGGFANTASGVNSGVATVGGGQVNNAAGDFSTVSGGQTNTASGDSSTVSGGQYNAAGGDFSTVAGGVSNNISSAGPGSAIGGGNVNRILDGAGSSIIGGGQLNIVDTGSFNSAICGGYGNFVRSDTCFIGGGSQNEINVTAYESAIGGGNGNRVDSASFGSAYYATIGGGYNNLAGNDGSFVGGGANNYADYYATVAGGNGSVAEFDYDTVGGGNGNMASGGGATVPGGDSNSAFGPDSFAAGGTNEANGTASFALGEGGTVNDNHAFLWCDGSRAGVSQGPNSFSVLATGGIWFFSGDYPAGIKLAPGSSSWATLSDRKAKKNIVPVDYHAVLDKLATVPIQQWNYNWEKDSDVPNIGPMAQDFKHAFYPGRDDKSITTLEFDGVELAAIQGLNQKLAEQDRKSQEREQDLEKTLNDKDTRISALEKRLDALEKLMTRQGLAQNGAAQ